MKNDDFRFLVYRLNKVFRNDLFAKPADPNISDDEYLRMLLKEVAQDKYDHMQTTQNNIYKWSIRLFADIDSTFSSFVLAKSHINTRSEIVLPNTIEFGETELYPPPADLIHLLIFWPRHLVIVENRSSMVTGETWLNNMNKLLIKSLEIHSLPISFELEPYPEEHSIVKHLDAMDLLIKFRVKLRLPNPDLSEIARDLYNEMRAEGIQEYSQEFYNPKGLNKNAKTRVRKSAAMAELGYKHGPARIEGYKNGKKTTIDEGKIARKGIIPEAKGAVQNLHKNLGSSLTKNAIKKLVEYISKELKNE
jgi:hypothetical protein